MPPGDAQRVWFPELREMLRKEWSPGLSWDQLIELRDRLDAELQTIRSERNIQPPVMPCPKCQTYSRQPPPRVSVRAAILALRRFEIAEDPVVEDLERRWNSHRRRHRLDLYGQPDNADQQPHPHDC